MCNIKEDSACIPGTFVIATGTVPAYAQAIVIPQQTVPFWFFVCFVASDVLTTICHLAIVNICMIIILYKGNTQISILLLCFLYLFVELMIMLNELKFCLKQSYLHNPSHRYPQTNQIYTTQAITVLKQTVPLGLHEDKKVCASWLH